MRIYENFNKTQNYLIIPITVGSILIALGELLTLISQNSGGSIQTVLINFSQLSSNLLPYAFCYFFAVSAVNGKRWLVGSWSVLCLAVFITAYKAVSAGETSLVFGLIIGAVIWFTHKYFNSSITFIAISAVISILLGLALGYTYDAFVNFNMDLSSFISGRGLLSGALFASVKTVNTLFDSDVFQNMFFYKSYGGSFFVNGEIVTGVKDLFAVMPNAKEVSAYLSGNYYLLFSVTGMSLAMLSNLKGAHKTALIVALSCMLLSGNLSVILLFFLLESPALLVAVILISVLSYVSAYIINVGAGYLYGGGIIEMFMYNSNRVYLIAGSIVFLAIGYFVYKYCYEKYGISDCYNIYIPTRLNRVVDALGGIKNIVRFKEDYVEVRNSQLVDNLRLECEINENIVRSPDKAVNELKEYFNENMDTVF